MTENDKANLLDHLEELMEKVDKGEMAAVITIAVETNEDEDLDFTVYNASKDRDAFAVMTCINQLVPVYAKRGIEYCNSRIKETIDSIDFFDEESETSSNVVSLFDKKDLH